MARKAKGKASEALTQWAENQRALARALGLSIEEWMDVLTGAGSRQTGVYAAVVGAAMAKGLGLAILDGLDGPALAVRAREQIDPKPPRVANPLLAEAIRRSDELGLEPREGAGAERLKRKPRDTPDPIPTPMREPKPLGDSANEGTPDAPGARRRGSSTMPPPRRKTTPGGDEE